MSLAHTLGQMMNNLLEVRDLSVQYGGLWALQHIECVIGEGEFVAFVGANGAGKTTLFKALSGVVKIAPGGTISFRGREMSRMPAHKRALAGIAHVPEGRHVFKTLTVGENLRLGAYRREGRLRWHEMLDSVYAVFPKLKERRDQLAGTLSGGEQQMLAIGRGLLACPNLLLLDEPSMGLAPVIVKEIFRSIFKIHRETGLTIGLVEQRAQEAMAQADRTYIIETGKIVKEVTKEDSVDKEEFHRLYLGL